MTELTSKRILCQTLLANREALSAPEHNALNDLLIEQLQSFMTARSLTSIGLCWPIRNEPDLREWAWQWVNGAPGRRLALPVVQGLKQPLLWRHWQPNALMSIDQFGIAVPAEGELITVEAILIPCNGFDRAGFRIGYGGGFFDRTLAGSEPGVLGIGVAFSQAELASALPESHDIALEWIVTDREVINCVA